MRVLGIETSATVASVALIENQRLLAQYSMEHHAKHSKTLMPMLEVMLQHREMKMSQVDLIAVSNGPGSFTGLRIGSATAKGLAYSLNIPVVPVPTLEVLASTVRIPEALVGVISHARAKEVYYAIYRVNYNKSEKEFTYEEIEPIETYEIEDLIKNIPEDVILVGDGVEKFEEQLEKLEKVKMLLKSPYEQLSALNVAILGLQKHKKGMSISSSHLAPYYHKPSQAEREYKEK